MNQDRDSHEATEIDPQVSVNYESLADENTPPELDRVVMREATRAVQADNRSGAFRPWFRPVAFIATVGLSLAIILELNDTGILSPPTDMSRETGRPDSVQSAVESAPDNAARTRTASSAADDLRRQKSTVKQSSKTAALDAVGDAAGSSAPVTTAAESLAPDPASTMKIQSGVTAPDVQLTAVQCTDEQRFDVDDWWKCIEELRQLGFAGTADLELDGLREEFPEFESPE